MSLEPKRKELVRVNNSMPMKLSVRDEALANYQQAKVKGPAVDYRFDAVLGKFVLVYGEQETFNISDGERE